MIAILASAASAAAQQPIQAGEYVTHGAWGELRIKESKGGRLDFSIETVGPNLHTCGFDGQIAGGKAIVNPSYAAQGCQVTFRAKNGLIEVEAMDGACREYCGARAFFDGSYYLPPEGCEGAKRTRRRADFLRLYRGKDYRLAFASLDGFYKQCADFMHWRTEADEVRNDLAITLFHLGRYSECLSTLATTRAGPYLNEGQFQEKVYLAPFDFGEYINVARQIWNNQKLCRNPPKPSPKP